MLDVAFLSTELAWPVALLIAWAAGELGQRWLSIPRISSYAITGFTLASSWVGLLPHAPSPSILLTANIAFGLLLFEVGYRINLRWLRANPWIAATSLGESALSFAAVFVLVRSAGVATDLALTISALSMATSPATVVRVINELRSAGQVTERVLHLSAFNCALAVLVLKVLAGTAGTAGDGAVEGLTRAASDTVLVVGAAVLAGALMGAFVPALLRTVRRTSGASTLAYAIAVIVLVAFNHRFGLSPVLATLTFGIVSRHRRVFLTPSQRGFGTLGDILGVMLFMFATATIEWRHVSLGLGLGLAIIVVRLLAKLAATGAFAFLSGTSRRKGLLAGIALTPMSAILLVVLEQTDQLGNSLLDQVMPLAAGALILEMLGPIVLGRALRAAQELPDTREV